MNNSNELNFLIHLIQDKKEIALKLIPKINLKKLIKISSKELLIPSLFFKLKKFKLLKHFPCDFIEYIQKIHQINYNRNLKLIDEVKFISEIFKIEKIEFVLIKGSSFIFDEEYILNERMIGDIDILVKKDKLQKAQQKLKDFGFTNSADLKKIRSSEHRHLPRLIKKNNLFAVEIHSRCFSKENNIISSEIILDKKINKKWTSIPNRLHQLLINILSFQINDRGRLKFKVSLRSISDSLTIIKDKEETYKEVNFNETYINEYLTLCEYLGFNKLSKKINFKRNITYLTLYKILNSNLYIYLTYMYVVKLIGVIIYWVKK
tara:strand:+ start:4597 stop:5556 length:960 start_codon:yes stop_codon:yes gene_type:complete